MTNGLVRQAEILGAVLAGGGSRRLGRDKALVEFEGQTLVERAVEVLDAVFAETVVVAPDRPAYRQLAVSLLPDLHPGQGPVGGLHTALVHANGRPVFVLACDMPLVTSDLVRWIVDDGRRPAGQARGSASDARVVRDARGAQPLCGLYFGRCLAAVEAALEEGRLSALELVAGLRTEILDLDPQARWFSPRLLANLNTPQDLETLAGSRGQRP